MGGEKEKMIVYKKFWDLCKEKGISTYYLRKNGVGSPTITKLQNDGSVIDTVTIGKLCRLLDCQPGDIMEYVPSEENE